MRLPYYQIQALLVATLLIPACGGGGSSSTAPPPPIFPLTVLQDDWSSGVSSNWIIVMAPVTVDGSTGNPLPSMLVGDSAEVRTASNFSTTLDLRIEMDVLGTDFTAISIYDSTNLPPGTPDAMVLLTDTAAAYRVGGTLFQQNFVADSNFHRYKFEIDFSAGTASWSRDGVVQVTGAFTTANIQVRVSGAFGATISIDNALILVP